MQIKIQKMLSFIVVLLLVLVNAMPVISYASEQVVDNKTSEENQEAEETENTEETKEEDIVGPEEGA